MKAFFRYLASTRSRLFGVILGLGLMLTSWGLRMPGGDILYLLAGATLVIIAVFFVIIRIVTRMVLRLRKRPDVAPAFAGWSTWMLGAVAILFIVIVGVLGVPFRLAFAVSRPQLEQLVADYKQGQSTKGDIWVGLFPISYVQPFEGGLQFTFRKAEIPWGRRGVYYSDSGERIERSGFYGQERVGSKWFSWHYGGW